MTLFRLLTILVFFYSCVPQGGNITVGPASQGAFAPAPDITHLTISGSQLILDGSNFEGVTFLSVKDPSNGSVKPFNVISATFSKLISENLGAASIPMDKALELILSNAYGQSTFPVTFSLQANSVDRTHIKNAEVTLNKLNPGPSPIVGQVIKWDGTKFILSNDLDSGGGGGGGGGISLDLATGLVGSSDPIIDSGMIAVDTGITGDPSSTKIPYFNSTNQLEVAGNAEILFSDPSNTNFSLFNNSGQFTIQKGNVSPAFFIMHSSGRVEVPVELFVKGFPVCNSNGDGCPGAFGSAVTNITVTPPLTGGGVGPTVNISPGLVNTANNLVVLDGTGGLPAGIKGVVNSVTAGSAISVTPASTGAVTVGVLFGAGNAQRHQTYLDNLGTLNPNDNYVIIGNGLSWEVQGGDALLTTLGAQKADADLAALAALTPYLAPNANMIVGSPLGWITQTVPNCSTGNVVIGDGNFLSCSPNTWNFSGGTLTSNNQLGMQLKAPGVGTATGELHFLGSNNSNFVGLKADSSVASNTIWTLPLTDGASGYGLTTDGSGSLSWTSVGGINDVSNSGTSTIGNLASFSSLTGKVIQDSGIASTNVVTMALPALAANRVLTSNGANKTAIDSGVTIDGSNNVSGIQNLTVKGTNANTPSALTSAIDFMTGRNSAGVYNAGQTSADLAFEQGAAGGGFKHYIATTHNNVAASNLNSFRFYLNNSTTAAGSSIPGTGNVLAMTITPLGVGILNSTPTNALDITGNTVMTGSLTINNNGLNSSIFPTGRGTVGQALTTDGGGALSWASVGGANDVSNATATTDNAIARFDGTTGKLIQNSGIIIADTTNNVTGMGTLNSRTIANWVDGPASSTATNLAAFGDITGKLIQDSGLLTANIPIMVGNGGAGNLVQTAAANKALSDSTIKVADVVTKSSNFSAANRVLIALNNTSRVASETGYTIPPSVCANTLVLKSDGTNMTCQADLNSGDVLGPGSSTDKGIVRFSGTGGKTIQNSNVVISDTDFLTGVSGIYIDNNTTPAGTNTPFSTLDVIGDITTSNHGNNLQHHASELSSKRIGHISGNNAEFTGMQLNITATDSTGAARANSSNIAFYTWGNSILASREVARITEFGRLGIGTTNPSQALSVVGNTTMTGSLTINNNGSNSSTFPTDRGSSGQALITDGGGALSWSTVTVPNVVTNAGGSTDNAIARFDSTTGKIIQNSGVIIADTTNDITGPQNITVSGTAIPTLRADGNTDNQQAGTLFLSQSDNFGFKIYYDALNTFDGMRITERRSGTDTVRMSFKNGGNVGIGTSDPTQLLDVAGNVRWTGNGYLTGSSFIEFGSDVVGKDVNAGKIGYGTFTANSLDMVGAGTSPNRKIKFWDDVAVSDSLSVGGALSAGATTVGTLSAGATTVGTLSNSGQANIGPYVYIATNGGTSKAMYIYGGNCAGTCAQPESAAGNDVGPIHITQGNPNSSNVPMMTFTGDNAQTVPAGYIGGYIDNRAANQGRIRIITRGGDGWVQRAIWGSPALFSDGMGVANFKTDPVTGVEDKLTFDKSFRFMAPKLTESVDIYLPNRKPKDDETFVVIGNKMEWRKAVSVQEFNALKEKMTKLEAKLNNNPTLGTAVNDASTSGKKIELLEAIKTDEPTKISFIQNRLFILRPDEENSGLSENEKLKREVALLREQNQRIQKQLDAINARLNPKVSSD